MGHICDQCKHEGHKSKSPADADDLPDILKYQSRELSGRKHDTNREERRHYNSLSSSIKEVKIAAVELADDLNVWSKDDHRSMRHHLAIILYRKKLHGKCANCIARISFERFDPYTYGDTE